MKAEDINKLPTMDFESIMNDMEEHLVIDPNSHNLDQVSLRCGRAFMAAQRHHDRESRLLDSIIHYKNQVELATVRYYQGTAGKSVYDARPLIRAPSTKAEIPDWVKADEIYINVCVLFEEQKRKVKFLEQCFDRVRGMGYDIKNAIDWRKYRDGN